VAGRPSFLAGGGRASDAIFTHDWGRTPLGPMSAWPQSLKTALGMMLSSSFPKAIVWGPALITFHNDAFGPILGEKPEAIGRPFNDVWAEAWAELKPMVDKAYAGEPTYIENFPLIVDRHGYPEEAYFTFCYSPIRDETGHVAGMMDTVIETTDTVMAQRQLAMVNGELSHRMRNLLTMVTAIANMSLRHAPTLQEGREALTRRLAALGQAQALLVDETEIDANVSELVDRALAPHATLRERIQIQGPACRLNAKQGLSLSLALNELITNSIKYGALSDNGAVLITWDPGEREDGRPFSFTWTETGVAILEKPSREGFGTKVLMQFVPSTFQGKASMDFGENCFAYRITAPATVVCQE
jgi:two-component sensor histidine kinase